MNKGRRKGAGQLTGNVTHLMIVKYRLSAFVTSHVCYRIVLNTIANGTGKGKAHTGGVGLAY